MLPNIRNEISRMRIEYPGLIRAHKVIDDMREARREAIAAGGRTIIEGAVITLFGETHAGKTTILNSYFEKNFPDDIDPLRPAGQSPQRSVVGITLNGVSTYTSFIRQTLKGFRDPLPGYGKDPDEKLNRIMNYIVKFETEVMAFDEANNLRMRKANDVNATQTHNTLRGFPKAGCSILVVGTEEATAKLLSDAQIVSIACDISIKVLKQSDEDDMRWYGDYCARLGVKLMEHGLFAERSNFVYGNTIACMFLASAGLRGRTSRLVERAAYIARADGASRVEYKHLEQATDEYSIANKIINYNPFRESRKTRKGETRVR